MQPYGFALVAESDLNPISSRSHIAAFELARQQAARHTWGERGLPHPQAQSWLVEIPEGRFPKVFPAGGGLSRQRLYAVLCYKPFGRSETHLIGGYLQDRVDRFGKAKMSAKFQVSTIIMYQ
jgi:hypothetical protein